MKKLGKGSTKLAPFTPGAGEFVPGEAAGDFVAAAPEAAPAAAPSWKADDFTPDAPEPAQSEIGTLEAGVRGAAQGATLNYSDELVGLGKALFGEAKVTLFGGDDRRTFSERYKAARDAERAANKAASEQHGFAYGAGDIAGSVATSLIPGLGIAKGASLAKTAFGAAKLGGVAGLGASEAETLPGQLIDAGTSALTSGVTAGVLHKVIGDAPKRAAQRLVGDVTDGVPAGLRDKIVGKAGVKGATEANDFNGRLVQIMRETPAIRKAGRDPNALVEAFDDALRPKMAEIDEIFHAAGKATKGIRVLDIQRSMDKIATDLESNPGTRNLARAVRNQMDDVWESWGQQKHVSANDVREFAKAVGDTAFFGSPGVAPKAGKAVAQEVWGSLKDLIDKNVNEAARKIGGPGAQRLRALNADASTMITARQGALYRATREATESTRLKDRFSGAVDIGLALADPSTFVAKKAYDFVGKPAVRAADERLAQLVTAAKAGSTRAQLLERALTLGFSPLVAQPLMNWVDRAAANVEGPQP